MTCDLWPILPECLPQGWLADPATWDTEQTAAVTVATEILKRLSGGVYGLCTLKIRPCRRRCEQASNAMLYRELDVTAGGGGGPWIPALIDGQLYNITCGCVGQCGCSPLCEIILAPGAYDVTEVRVNGTVLPASDYRVDDNRRLVRTDEGCWPECQELRLPDTQPGTFSITFRTGQPVPAGGQMAVTDLALNLYQACRGKTCQLPSRVTQVVRDGVTWQLLDDLSVFDRGRTGLPRVDLWLASVNPYASRGPMRVWSPDTVRSRRTTWP